MLDNSVVPVKKKLPAKRLIKEQPLSKRVLALVDLSNHPRGTVEMAVDLTNEYGAELALGSIVGWDLEHNADLSIARVSDTLLTSLRGPAESRLKGLAISAGSVHCQILVSTKQDAEEATLEMVTDWHPDLLVIASNGIYDIDRSRHMVCRTPSGLLKVNIQRFSP